MTPNCTSGTALQSPANLTEEVCFKVAGAVYQGTRNVTTTNGVATVVFTDMNGVVHTGATQVVCPPGVTVAPPAAVAVEAEQEVFCDGTNSFLRWYTVLDGVPTGGFADTGYDGKPYVPLGPVARGECARAAVSCVPSISSALASTLAGLLPGSSISVQKPACCSIKVSTSAGEFIVAKDVTGYSTGDFDRPVTVTGVTVLSGLCDLAEVIVTTQFRGL